MHEEGDSGDAQRDAHLKSADFFDVEKFPTLSFKSTRVSLVRDGELAVEGDLTIRGVTRKVLFSVEGPTPPVKHPGATPELRYRRPRRSTVKTSA
jgi:polyisoprenoid-binding protein YceI